MSVPNHRTNQPRLQIAESFRRFGITPTTTSLLVIKIAPASAAGSIAEHLGAVMEGDAVEFADAELSSLVDVKRVRKIYKLGAASGGGGGGGKGGMKGADMNGVNGGVGQVKSEEDERRELSIAVLGMMALRGATN
jgi:EKC/KEOPS complex subunit CGI121/TPRKB